MFLGSSIQRSSDFAMLKLMEAGRRIEQLHKARREIFERIEQSRKRVILSVVDEFNLIPFLNRLCSSKAAFEYLSSMY